MDQFHFCYKNFIENKKTLVEIKYFKHTIDDLIFLIKIEKLTAKHLNHVMRTWSGVRVQFGWEIRKFARMISPTLCPKALSVENLQNLKEFILYIVISIYIFILNKFLKLKI